MPCKTRFKLTEYALTYSVGRYSIKSDSVVLHNVTVDISHCTISVGNYGKLATTEPMFLPFCSLECGMSVFQFCQHN